MRGGLKRGVVISRGACKGGTYRWHAVYSKLRQLQTNFVTYVENEKVE